MKHTKRQALKHIATWQKEYEGKAADKKKESDDEWNVNQDEEASRDAYHQYQILKAKADAYNDCLSALLQERK